MIPCRKIKTAIPFVLFVAFYHGIYMLIETHWNLEDVNTRTRTAGFETVHSVSREYGLNALKEMRSVSELLAELRLDVQDGEEHLGKKIEERYDSLQNIIRDFEQMLGVLRQNTEESQRKTTFKQQNINASNNSPVCAEIYQGSTHGYPFFHTGFVSTNCSKTAKMSSLITIIFDQPRFSHTQSSLLKFGREISRLYPGMLAYFPIAGRPGKESLLDWKSMDVDINFQYYDEGVTTKGAILQKVLDNINTPFVLIARDLTAFTSDINLERLIRVLTSGKGDVHFAGGAVRTPTGKWYAGCLQSQLRNYTLQYKEGYFKSFSECMVCDDLQGSFLVRTNTIKNLTFDSKLSHYIYHDLFIRAIQHFGRESTAIVTCPDVMFETQLHHFNDIDKLLTFVDKYEIDTIIDSNKNTMRFGCQHFHRTGVTCPHRSGMAVKPCCLENLAKAVKFVMHKCTRYGIFCELQEGTLLGAVKMNKVLPWERDADITFLSSQFEKVAQMKGDFQREGYMLVESEAVRCCEEDREAGGKFEVVANGWVIELFGQHKMESEILTKKGLGPTQVLFDGEWLNAPRNPGQHVRNRYGPEMYRHAEHWTATGADSGWSEYDTTGFGACPMKGHNGCLDQYEVDGNIQFENNWTKVNTETFIP